MDIQNWSTTSLLIVVVIFVLIYISLHKFYTSPLHTIVVGGLAYHVADVEEAQKAAEMLKELNIFVLDIMRQLKLAMYAGTVPSNKRYFVENLINKYRPTRIYEGLPVGTDTSFVIDKGEKLVLCLRDRNMQFHDKSLLHFVILHEISHIGSIEVDHKTEFWSNFKWLLQFAAANNLYQPVDYRANPVEYCKNIHLGDNPYFDM